MVIETESSHRHSEAYYVAMDLQRDHRMFDAIESSYKSLQPFRELNRGLVNEYTGHNYGTYAAVPRRKKYLNKLFQAINGHVMLLAANRPQIMVQTEYRELKPFANHYQLAVNNLLKEIEIESTLRDWVLSALFCLGIIKVHLKESGVVKQEWDVTADPGCPFASNVYLDDWVHDMGVKRYSQIKFSGDMYRIPFSMLEKGIEDGTYDEEAASELTPTSKSSDVDPARVDKISSGHVTDIDEFEPMLDIADIWLPGERVIKTYAVESRRDFRLKGQPLSIMEWDGIEIGPYHLLGFSDVPENIMPTSPASHWEALDEFLNICFRKKSRQTNRMKENLCANSSGAGSAKSLKNAADGEVLGNVNLEQVRLFRQGGSDPSLDNTIQNTINLFDLTANNLGAILGSGPQAETLGQEELIHKAGNRLAAQMQYRVVDGTSRVISNLGCLLWKDEFKEIAGSIETGETSPLPTPWLPGDREGNFQQYNFKVVPFSMQDRSPAQQSSILSQLLTTIYIPLQEQMAAQGIVLDFATMTKTFANLLYLPELNEIVAVQGAPTVNEQKPQSQVAGKSPVTTRNYNRRSSSGPPGNDQLVAQQPGANGSNGHANGSSNGWSSSNGWVQ